MAKAGKKKANKVPMKGGKMPKGMPMHGKGGKMPKGMPMHGEAHGGGY